MPSRLMTQEEYDKHQTKVGRTARKGQNIDAMVQAAKQSPAKLPKPSKMRNRKCVTEHGTFDSEKEARRYGELLLLKGRDITELSRQKRFRLIVNGHHICDYVADFHYWDMVEGGDVVEDVKPTFKSEASRKAYQRTDAYRRFVVKKKLMLAIFGIDVKEI